MIERYTRPEMGRIWTDESRFQRWLEVELAVCEVRGQRGEIPADSLQTIRRRARFDVAAIREIEQRVKHDVIAFLTNVGSSVGPDARYIHFGLTSSDVIDTALALQLRDASDLLIGGVERLKAVLQRRAREHRMTVMAGFAHVDPEVEEAVCRRLGLAPAPVSTQILQRDRHAEFVAVLAITASSIDKFATEIRNLQRTDIREVEELFSEGQKGSSAMPHKRNPVGCEQLSGLARVVRANAQAALENVTLWHERDISHSSAERIILPDSTILLDYMLDRFTTLVDGLIVYPERMKENLERTRGLVFSQSILLALLRAGAGREQAYEWVQRCAMRAWQTDANFRELAGADPDIRKILDPKQIAACFDFGSHLRHIDTVFRRVFGADGGTDGGNDEG
ncbi:MAG: adenylosuccinate lyase [Acidobacteria bacterium]|nr:MAG: adenylosuccinate lyase [Acidobacteriota bacterium]